MLVYSVFIRECMLDMWRNPYETQSSESINNIVSMLSPKWKILIMISVKNRVMIAVVIKKWVQNKLCQIVHHILKIPVSRPFSSFLDKRNLKHNNRPTLLYNPIIKSRQSANKCDNVKDE